MCVGILLFCLCLLLFVGYGYNSIALLGLYGMVCFLFEFLCCGYFCLVVCFDYVYIAVALLLLVRCVCLFVFMLVCWLTRLVVFGLLGCASRVGFALCV